MNLFDLTGKFAVVTGGSKGLGRGMAEGLAQAGASVVIVGSSAATLEAAKEMQDAGLKVQGLKWDISDKEKLPALMDKAVEMLGGRIDILVNSAGIQKRHKSEVFPLADFEEVLSMNLTVQFVLCQLAGQRMLAQGSGKIINVASLLSFFGGITVPAYAASKGGVAQLTKALSNEWAGKNIQVNSIAPGYMDTDMNVALIADETRYRDITARIPAGRWGNGNDMKGVAVFLASDASNYVSGAVIPVDGGYLGK